MGLFDRKKIDSGHQIKEDHEALLDQTLYTVPSTNTNITWADSVEGTLITGSTGSGKSSGAGRHIAMSMLRSGFGMCVLCAKPNEAKQWQVYAQDAGRSNDIVLFNKESGLKFNFLKYEMDRSGEGAGEIQNVVEALIRLKEQSKIHQSGGGGKEDKFWDESLRRLIARSISLLRFANEEISISNMRRVVANCFIGEEPKTYNYLKEQITTKKELDPVVRKKAKDSLEIWVKSNYFLELIEKVDGTAFQSSADIEESQRDINYWTRDFPRMAEKTTSIIIESFMGIIEPFNSRGILKGQFSEGLSTDLLPENIATQNKIVILDFAIKEFGLAAIYAATIYKTTFQAAMERRKVKNEEAPKPVGLWIDEYQSFVSPITDSLFQATARSSWVATVYITQNINNLYFVMGQDMPMSRAKGLLGNMNLKYFCSNSDFETNNWASNMIGKHLAYVESISYGKNNEMSKSKNQQMQFRITPDHFTTLKTGRKNNKYIVESVVFKAGKLWGKEKNKNYALVEFNQRG